MGLEIIIGIGMCAFLLLFFAFQWDKKEHYLLQLLVSFFFIFLLLLIPKAVSDTKDMCQIVVANETTLGNTTTYGYDYFCETNVKTTASTFYKIIMWFTRVFMIYIFLYFLWVGFIKGKIVRKMKQ